MQYVHFDGVDSSSKHVNFGVPQGSVLGPILFLLYINDLYRATDMVTLLFADDTTFQLRSSNIHELFGRANQELARISEWFKSNKLTLNVQKTKYMIFKNHNSIYIQTRSK